MKLYAAEAIKEQVHKLLCKDCEETNDCSICDYRELIDGILNAPTIEAEPVRHGHWITTGFLTARCSVCDVEVHELEYGKYCPYCGAKMDEERMNMRET